jgi:DNA replication protein DnaC
MTGWLLSIPVQAIRTNLATRYLLETHPMTETMTDALAKRAADLKLYGLLAHWDELDPCCEWIRPLIEWEEQERNRRGLERRLRNAHLGRFKPLGEFDWDWPKKIDREQIQDLMQLDFVRSGDNVILLGSNGVGKSTIARNLAHQAVLKGYSVLFTGASEMLNALDAQDGNLSLQRRLKYYAQPQVLVIDEVGYLSYANRHADLLFDIINRRYEEKSTIVTTNRPFSEWHEVFPNAACVVSLVDRLIHHATITSIDGDSYRMKEAQEKATKQTRNAKRAGPANRKTTRTKK